MYYKTNFQSPIGDMMIASDGEKLVGLWLEGQKYYGGVINDELLQKDNLPIFDVTKDWLDRYFGGEKPYVSELPLSLLGGEFRQMVWKILCKIPYGECETYGECVTYGDIAKKMADKMRKPSMSAQAVGGAVGHNPISVIIPCHRVVGANGSLTDRKSVV